MAVPIEIPTGLGFSTRVFDIGHVQQNNPSGDIGFIQTINRSSPAWYAEYSTPPLRDARYDVARGFFDRLEGSMNTFLGYDPRRPMPRAYMQSPVGSDPWGAPSIAAQDYANSTISLTQMASGAIISQGDYISVKVGLVWYLFRAMETRVPAGTTVNALFVKPRPNIASFVATPIRYQKACIEMKMIGDVQEQDSVDTFPSFQFRAAQFTRRADI